MSKRIVWIDIAKGLLIILVVLGHCEINNGLKYVICSFYMGAFFFLSGLTFSVKKEPKVFLERKIKSLLVPYCFFSIIMTAYNFAKHLLFDSPFKLKEAILSIVFPISGKYESSVYGLWFLPCIFLTELLLYSIIKIYHKNRFISVVYGLTITILLVLMYEFTKIACVLTIVPTALVFMLLGLFLKKIVFQIDNKHVTVFFGGVLILFVLSVFLNRVVSDSSLDMSSLNLGCIPFYILSTLFGSLLVCVISIIVSKLKFTKVIIFIGTYSLYFYGFHYEILGLLSSFIKNPYLLALIALLVLLPIVYIYIKIKFKTEGKLNDKCNSSGL